MSIGKVEAYEISVVLDIDSIIEKTGRETAKDVRSGSPKRRRNYANGWTSNYQKKNQTATVYNSTRPSLTHLIENGHLTRLRKGHKGKKRVKPYPHIRPAYERNARKYISEMKKVNIQVKTKKI